MSAACDARVLSGAVLIAMIVGVRCLAPFDPFPFWSGDPFEIPAPVVGLTPRLSMLLDGVVMLAAALCATGMNASELRRAAWSMSVCVVALIPLTIHAQSGPNGLDNIVQGSTWLSMLVTGAIAFSVGARPQARRIMIAMLAGVGAALAVRASFQVFVEHPQTLANYRATREAFFRSQGWSPGSPMALAFERRMLQPVATGYFGLSNALATLGVGVCVFGVGLLAWKGQSVARRIWLLALAASGVIIVILTGAKGGYAALLLGLALLTLGMWMRARGVVLGWRLARLVGPVIVLLTLGAVVVRGVIGERIGELSVLFRWFYMQAATRIFASQPIIGAGPAGFRDAYLLKKNPLSPEEVSSPHSILFDLACGMGIAGLLAGLLWMLWVSRTGVALAVPSQSREHTDASDTLTPGQETRLVFAMIALPLAFAVFLEREAFVADTALARLLGGALAMGVAGATCGRLRDIEAPRASVALGAGALAVASHCQIELTGVTPGAGAWVALLLGTAASGVHFSQTGVAPVMKRGAVSAAIVLAMLSQVARFRSVWSWEGALRRAHEPASPIAEFAMRRDALATGRPLPELPHDTPADLARDLSRASGSSVPATPAGIDSTLSALRQRAMLVAINELATTQSDNDIASGAIHFPTLRALSRLHLSLAQEKIARGDFAGAGTHLEDMRTLLDAGTRLYCTSSAYWSWVGTASSSAAELAQAGGRNDAMAFRAHALTVFEKAAALGPHELHPARSALQAAREVADAVRTAHWARECLRINEQLRLDPLEQLTGEQLAEIERLAVGP